MEVHFHTADGMVSTFHTMHLSVLISEYTTQILFFMKLGKDVADEMIPTFPSMPLLGLISVFDIVSALIVTTQHCAVSRDSALAA